MKNLIVLVFALVICIGIYGCSKPNNSTLENDTIEQYQDSNSTTLENNTIEQNQDSNSTTLENNTIEQHQDSNSTTLENNTINQHQDSNSTTLENNTIKQHQNSNNSLPTLRADAYTNNVSKNTFIGESFTIEDIKKMTKDAIGELTPFEVKFVYDPNIDEENDVIYINNEKEFKYSSYERYSLLDYMCYLCFRSGQHVVFNDGNYGRVTFSPEYPFNRLKYGADNANLGNKLLISTLIKHNALNKAISGVYWYGEAESKVCHYYKIDVPNTISESDYKSIVNDVIKNSQETFPEEAYKVIVTTKTGSYYSSKDILYEENNIYVPNYD